MDPLSALASVTGLIVVTAKVAKELSRLSKRSRRASKAIRHVENEVDIIRHTLEQLQPFVLGQNPFSHGACILVEQLVVVLSTCVATFSELEVLVESLHHDESTGIMDRLRWLQKEGDVIELCEKLRDHKASLTMLITILNA